MSGLEPPATVLENRRIQQVSLECDLINNISRTGYELDNPGCTACYDLMTMCACCNFSNPLLISIIFYLFEFYSVGRIRNCSKFNEALYWIPCIVFVLGKLRSKVLEVMCALKSACSD